MPGVIVIEMKTGQMLTVFKKVHEKLMSIFETAGFQRITMDPEIIGWRSKRVEDNYIVFYNPTTMLPTAINSVIKEIRLLQGRQQFIKSIHYNHNLSKAV